MQVAHCRPGRWYMHDVMQGLMYSERGMGHGSEADLRDWFRYYWGNSDTRIQYVAYCHHPTSLPTRTRKEVMSTMRKS